MRIAITGAQNTGKTTLVKDFLQVWPTYKTTDKNYREILKDKNLPHSTKTGKETQLTILNWMVDELKKTTNKSDIIFDRCPLDCLAYTLWAYEKGGTDIDEDFVSYVIKQTKESMRYLDIIFYVPANIDKISIENDGFRNTDQVYQLEIDTILKSLKQQLEKNNDADVFFPKGDSPGLIEVSGTREQRLVEIGLYISPDGGLYGDEHSIFNPKHLHEMETIIKEQQEQIKLAKQQNIIK